MQRTVRTILLSVAYALSGCVPVLGDRFEEVYLWRQSDGAVFVCSGIGGAEVGPLAGIGRVPEVEACIQRCRAAGFDEVDQEAISGQEKLRSQQGFPGDAAHNCRSGVSGIR